MASGSRGTRGWDSTHLGLLVFALAAAVGFVVAVVPAYPAHPQLTIAGTLVAGLTIAVAVFVVRWPRPPLVAGLVILFYIALALLVFGDSGRSEGLLALVAIPVVASALYGPRTLTILALVAAIASLAGYGAAHTLSVDDDVQLLAVWPVTGIVMAFAIHSLRSRLERTITIREQALQHEAVLALVADELYSTFDGDQVIQLGIQSAARLTDHIEDDASRAAFFLIDGEKAMLIATYIPAPAAGGGPDPRIDHLSVPLGSTRLLRDIAGPDEPLFTLDRSTVIPADIGPALTELGVENAIVQAIRVGETRSGLLVVFNDRMDGHPYTPAQEDWIRSFAPVFELAISRALVYDELTTTDPLTGLVNRREVDRRLAAMPRSTAYSIIAIDVDKLKTMNDTFGHPAGDELLQVVANALQRSIRRGDTAARVGGDEFCIILPDASGRADVVAKRLLADLGRRAVRGISPSISIGIAGFASGSDAASRVAAADAALYDAKHAGGNRAAHAPAVAPEDRSPAPQADGAVPVAAHRILRRRRIDKQSERARRDRAHHPLSGGPS